MKLLKLNFFVLFFLLSVFNIFGQSARVRTFDAQHYIIRSNFDRKNKIYFGDTTVQVKPLKDGFNTLVLDSVGMKFDSVTLESDGTTLDYKQVGDKINVYLGKSFSPNDLVSVR